MGLQVRLCAAPDSEPVNEGVEKEMNAIIVTGGKQYKVAEGDVLFIEKLDVEAGESVKFDQVLAIIGGEVHGEARGRVPHGTATLVRHPRAGMNARPYTAERETSQNRGK